MFQVLQRFQALLHRLYLHLACRESVLYLLLYQGRLVVQSNLVYLQLFPVLQYFRDLRFLERIQVID